MAQRPRTLLATKAKRASKSRQTTATRKTPAKATSPKPVATKPVATKPVATKSAASAKPTPPERKLIKSDEAKRQRKPATVAVAKAKDRPTPRTATSGARKQAKAVTPKPAERETAKIAKAGKVRSKSASAPKTKRAAAPAGKAPKASGAGASKSASKRASKATAAARSAPAYLAAELGQPVDHEGEPIGAGSSRVRGDAELQEYALQLWRQMQSGGIVKRYLRAIERAGLTVDEVWTVGLGEVRSTSSTPDEMRRYKQRLLFRANLLEALLTETIADLHRLEGVEPTPAPPAASAWSPSSTASA